MRVVVLANLSRTLAGWEQAMAMLRDAGHEVVDPGPEQLAEPQAAVWAKEADGLLVGLNPIGRAILEAARGVRVVAKPGIGVDNIDVAAATELGIAVCNTPGSNADAVADHTLALLLAVLRNLLDLDRRTRSGRGWERWPYVGAQLAGKTAAVIGLGQIGKAVARRMVLGFGMRALAYDLAPDPDWARELGVRYGALAEILPLADVVSVHVPLSESTWRLVGPRELALLRPHAVLVNTARGGVVDEAALAEALRHGKLAGAGVDVFEREPCERSPLFELDNVVLTPHIAGYSPEASVRSRLMTAENLIEAFAGRPRHLVNPRVTARPNYRLAPGR